MRQAAGLIKAKVWHVIHSAINLNITLFLSYNTVGLFTYLPHGTNGRKTQQYTESITNIQSTCRDSLTPSRFVAL